MSEDETYEIPLQDQRVFGAGIKRKRVKFIPSADSISNPPRASNTTTKSASEIYLSLVLPDEYTSNTASNISAQAFPLADSVADVVCDICHLPFSLTTSEATPDTAIPRPHEASLAHQVCLKHSHPPSHIDRNRKGLHYLSSYGWDPDSRLGLGAKGEGIQFPIKAKMKDDKMGLGLVLPKEARSKEERESGEIGRGQNSKASREG